MGLWASLKDIMSGSGEAARGAARMLKPIDTEKIARDLDLVSKARANGLREFPKTNSSGFDDVEASVIHYCESEWRLESANVIDQLKAYAVRLVSLNTEAEWRRLMLRAEDALTKLRASHHIAVQELGHLKNRFAEANTEFKAFRSRQGLLERPARNQYGRWTSIGLMVLLIALESVLNGVFFAEGSRQGLIGGVGTAVGISAVNIVLAFLLGLGPARWINHRLWLIKLVGLALVICGASALFALHAFAAHLRDASTALLSPIEATSAALEALVTKPWTLTDLSSYYLFALGILFAGMSIWKGYAFDDPYPNYGRQYRRLEEARNDYGYMHSEVFDSLEEIKDDTIADIDNGIDRIPKYPQEVANIVTSRSALIATFREYEASLETAVRDLLSRYRSVNREARSTPAPNHFDEKYEFSRSAIYGPDIQKEFVDPPVAPTNLQHDLEALRAKSHEVLEEYERLLTKFPHATDIGID